MISEVITTFIAGTDTTSLGICWTLYYLSLTPAALHRLREEVDEILVSKLSREKQVESLVYTQACFKEAMRLRGPVSHIAFRFVDPKGQNYTLQSGMGVYCI